MENIFLMLAIVFIVGALIGVKFIFGLFRYFPMFPIFSFGRQDRTNKQESDSGGSAVGSTMIFIFVLSFILMFMYYEQKIEDVEQIVTDSLVAAPKLEEEPDLGIPGSIDPNDPQTRYDNELRYVEHSLPTNEQAVRKNEFKNDISNIDRGTLTEDLHNNRQKLFYYQVTASSRKAKALEVAEKMKSETDKRVFLGEEINYSPYPFKVLVGPFEEKADAKKFGRRMHLEGFATEADHLQLYRP